MVSREDVLVRGNICGDILVSQGNTFWVLSVGKRKKEKKKKEGKWSAQEISGDYYQKMAKSQKKPSKMARTRNLLQIK